MIEHQPSPPDSSHVEIRSQGGQLSELDPSTVIQKLAVSGHVLFRGFVTDLASFGAFVRAFSSSITLNPARSFPGGEVAQSVDAGAAAMGLHLENGNTPFAPDLTWFFCERAASHGSQTTVCDGYRVWDCAAEWARQPFRAQDVVYSRRVEERKWKAFVFHHLGGKKPLDEIIVEDLLALVRGHASMQISAQSDGAIHYVYRVPAVHPTLFGSRLAWANSIFGPSYNYEAPRISFADGSELPPALIAEMRALTEALTVNIEWQDGDVALIDNTRVMHGRRAIEDAARRKLYNAQSYLKERYLDQVRLDASR